MARAGCESLAAFRALSPEKLFAAWQEEKADQSRMAQLMGHCMDGCLLTKSTVAAAQGGEQKNIPYMMGSTSHDVMPPFIYKMAKTGAVCRRIRENSQAMPGFLTECFPAMRTAHGTAAICGTGLGLLTTAGAP